RPPRGDAGEQYDLLPGHHRRQDPAHGQLAGLISGLGAHATSSESAWPAAKESTSACEALGGSSAAIRPARKTITRSEMRSTSARSVVITSTAVPWSAREDMIRWISSLAATCTPWG